MKLNNKRILIARPMQQADHLSNMITDAGGISIKFPTVEIQSLRRTNKLKEYFNKIGSYDFIIFISRNAVEITIKKFVRNINLIRDVQLVAIGPSTAKALYNSNLKNIIFPRDNVDTEGLLSQKEMKRNKIVDQRILIIRGVGGRELLAESLKKRGAIVDCIEIYKRKLPRYKENEINKAWHDNNPDAVVITSNEVLNNLIILIKNDTESLFMTPLVAISERVAEYARKRGIVSKISVVREKSDDGIFSALHELFED